MAFAQFYKDEEYSDLTIKFSDREFPCHKFVLCTQSDYFKKLCGKGSHFAESQQKTIELKEDEPDALEAVLRYLYLDAYYEEGDWRQGDWSFHFEVARTAQKYLIPMDIKSIRVLSFRLLDRLDTASAIYDAIRLIDERYSDDDMLRQKAAALKQQHINALIQEPRFVQALTFGEKVEQFDRMAKMLGSMVERQGWLCRSCGLLGVSSGIAYCEDCPGVGGTWVKCFFQPR